MGAQVELEGAAGPPSVQQPAGRSREPLSVHSPQGSGSCSESRQPDSLYSSVPVPQTADIALRQETRRLTEDEFPPA